MSEPFPVLYILMRTDLASMNAGKGHAQASHASNAFVFGELKRWAVNPMKTGWNKFLMFVGLKAFVDDLFLKWVHATGQGFGTVLVLGVNEIEMRTAVDIAHMLEFQAEVIHDPTYPLVDGSFCHILPLDTCGYIFGDKNDPLLGAVVGNFSLHP